MEQTSEERREVAERLRGLDSEITSCDTLERAVDKFMKAVLGERPFSPIRYSVRNLCGLGYVLADLIDPTCHVVNSGEWRGRPIGSACSVCHAPLYPSTAWAHGMRYCSQCGHRVVDDDNE